MGVWNTPHELVCEEVKSVCGGILRMWRDSNTGTIKMEQTEYIHLLLYLFPRDFKGLGSIIF
jgi:hypothetical protein